MVDRNSNYQNHNTNHANHDPKETMEERVERVSQDIDFLEVMEKLIDRDSENFFLNLAQKGVKLPNDFNIDQLKKDHQQDGPMNVMTR